MREKIILTPAGPEDAERLHAMSVQAFLPLYERYHDDGTNPAKEPLSKIEAQLRDPASDWYIIRADGAAAGGVRVVREHTEEGAEICRISPLFVLPALQRRGIGSAVMQQLFARYGAGIWRLAAIRQETATRRFYERCGFRATGKELPVNERMTLMFYEKNGDTHDEQGFA